MARFEDYVQKYEVQDEIEAAQVAQVQRQEQPEAGFVLPERFHGKSAEDVAASYVELEKAYSRQGHELGSLRATADRYILESVHASPQNRQSAAEPTKPVTVDDLYDDADGTLRRVIKEESNGRVEELERELQQTKAQVALAQFETKHPDWRQVASTPEFQNFLAESPYRVKLFQAADKYDFDAAETLFGIYNDLKGRKQQVVDDAQQRRNDQLTDASLETSSPHQPDLVQVYSRAELQEKRISAKQGNGEAERWLQAHAEEIAIAYEEDRIVA